MFTFSPIDLGTMATSVAGGLFENFLGDNKAEKANQFSAQQAAINRDFQERMSNTAYQRGMEDMKKAGLNPILAYQKGPASSPSGATASTSMAPVTPFSSSAVSASTNARRVTAEVENMAETNANLREQNKNLQAQNVLTQAQTLQASAAARKTVVDTAIASEMLQKAKSTSAEQSSVEAYRKSNVGQITTKWREFISDLVPFFGTARQSAETADRLRNPGVTETTEQFGPRGNSLGSQTRIRVNRRRD